MKKGKIFRKILSYILAVTLSAIILLGVDMGWNVEKVQAADAGSENFTPDGTSTGTKTGTLNGEYIKVEAYMNSRACFWFNSNNKTKISIQSGKADTYVIKKIELSILGSCNTTADATTGWTITKGQIDKTASIKVSNPNRYSKLVISNVDSSSVEISRNTLVEYGTMTVYYGLKHVCSSSTVTEDAGQAATCTVDGWNAYSVCSCNKVYAKDDFSTSYASVDAWKSSSAGKIPKIGHDFTYSASDNVITATCQRSGCSGSCSLTLSASNATYTGSAYSGASTDNATVGFTTTTGTTLSDIKYYKGDEELTGAPKNAGTYKSKITVGGATAEKEFTISPKNVEGLTKTALVGSENAPVWTGSEMEPTVTITDGATTLVSGTDYELTGDLKATATGDYTITITGKGNYTGTTTATWKINGQDFTETDITATPYSGEYDATAHTITVSVLDGATVTYSETEDGTYGAEPIVVTDVTSGAKTIYYIVQKEGYNDKKGSSTVTITKAPLTIIPDDNQSKDYSDTDPTLTYTVDTTNGLRGNDTTDVLSGSLSYVGTDVGNYEITGTFTADNYSVTVQSGKTFEIKQKSVAGATVTFAAPEIIYTGSPITCDVASVVVNGRTLVAGTDYNVSGEVTKTDYGTYTVTIAGTGNYKETTTATWKIIDVVAPTGDIKIETSSIKKAFNEATFGLFFKNTQTVTITSDDDASGVDKVYYSLSENIKTEDEVRAISDWSEYSSTFNIDPDKKLVVYAKIVDKAGNTTFIGSDGLVLDGTAPTILGVDDNKTYCEEQVVHITDDNLLKVTVNGDEVTLTDGAYTLAATNTTYTIVASDKAGNDTSVVVTVNSEHTWGEYVSNNNASTQADGTEEAKCEFCDAIDIRDIPGTKIDVPVNTTVVDTKPVGSGTIETNVNTDKSISKVTVRNLSTDVAKQFLTAEEIESVNAGADAIIFLDVTNIDKTVSTADRTAVVRVANGITSGRPTVALYLDLSLYKKLSDSAKAERITDTNGEHIKVSFAIPSAAINNNSNVERTYYVVRVHDGVSTILKTAYDEATKVISFESDKFSTYALLYVDKDIPTISEDDETSTYTTIVIPTSTDVTITTLAPKTGDENNLAVWLFALFGVVALLGGVLVFGKKEAE